jgi:hypothetical protein
MSVQVQPQVIAAHCHLPLFIAALLLGLVPEVVAAATDPPKFDVSQSCEGAAREALVVGRNKETCMADERTAQNEVARNWPQHAARDRAQCVGMVSKGGPPSYVELLSCLEVMRDARTTRLNGLEDPLLNNEGQMGTQSLGDLDENAFDTSGSQNRNHGQRQKRQRGRRR